MRPPRVVLLLLTQLVALLLGLAALGGCESEPEPEFPDPTTPVGSSDPPTEPSSTPPPSSPTVDPAEETAEEFIRRFQSEAFAIQRSGDTGTYRAMSAGCDSCDGFATAVEDHYAKGGSATVGEGRVLEVQQVGRTPEFKLFEYTLRSMPGELRDASGDVVDSFEGGESRFQISLRRTDSDEWLVTDLVELA